MSGSWVKNGSLHQPATYLTQVTGGRMRNADVLPLVLHRAGLQGLSLPSFKPKEPRSVRDISGLMDGGVHTSEASSGTPLYCGQQAGQGSSLCSQGEVEIASYQGNGHQVGSCVTRETSRGARPSTLL